ncbi:MAG: glutamate 5-kinase [Elusimicrobia bacterium]|nr:glutamate 5-kinase [Elusimicrobiota bacterium]
MHYKRVVIKIGTSTLTDEDGRLNLPQLRILVEQVAQLSQQGREVILVTSGAVGAGRGKLGLKSRPQSVREKQAAAAVGQTFLMRHYEELFNEFGFNVAQILLTQEDMRARERYLNARNTIMTLLEYKVIPIINENDTVAVDEIRFGDNDTLSALVASKVEADLLIILSDVAGLYTADPRQDKDAEMIHTVDEINEEVEKIALKSTGSARGVGGMYTKIQAAKIATASGVMVVIADGMKPGILKGVFQGDDSGTKLLPRHEKISGRKKWIAFANKSSGRIHVDSGAAKALLKMGKSLLPSGITEVEGNFRLGDMVTVVAEDGDEIARGLVSFPSAEIEKIKGQKTSEIMKILGHKDYDEVIHRDNLVIL